MFGHLERMGKVKTLDNWAPRKLTENQRLRRFGLSSVLTVRNDHVFHRIVTSGEKWILDDDGKRFAQCLDRDEAPIHFTNPEWHQQKVSVSV